MKLVFMYVNKSNKLTQRNRFRIIKQYVQRRKVIKIAEYFDVSRQTVYKIIKKFEKESTFGLEDKKPGPLKTPLNPKFYANVVKLRKEFGFGALKIEKHFKDKGFSVSHNKINEVIQIENLTFEKMGKRKIPKYIRYEAENNNDQWHMDWSVDPISKKQLFAIIDDKSRFIVFSGLFDSANAENTVFSLQKAITKYGVPKEIVTDNGAHFKDIPNKKVNQKLGKIEEKYGIKHIFIRVGHPQSNGKIERWFGSYKGEFARMNHPKIYDLQTWTNYYNFERIHQSLGYETPAQRYLVVN